FASPLVPAKEAGAELSAFEGLSSGGRDGPAAPSFPFEVASAEASPPALVAAARFGVGVRPGDSAPTREDSAPAREDYAPDLVRADSATCWFFRARRAARFCFAVANTWVSCFRSPRRSKTSRSRSISS